MLPAIAALAEMFFDPLTVTELRIIMEHHSTTLL
jgi:hypothetical protein